MRHDATTEAAKAADLALDNQDLRAVVVFIVETLVLNEAVAQSCLGRRSLVAACPSSKLPTHRRSTGASGASRSKRNASRNCARRRARAAGGLGYHVRGR